MSISLHSEACNAKGASYGVIHSRISHEVSSLRATANNDVKVSMEEVSFVQKSKREGLCQSLQKTCRMAPWTETKHVCFFYQQGYWVHGTLIITVFSS